MPPSNAPLISVHGFRSARHMAAYRIRGLFASIERSTAPVLSLMKRTFSQFSPPSLERKIPRSGLGPKGWPNTAAYTRSVSFGCTRTRAICPASGRPMCVHVRPASVDLYAPTPTDTLPRMQAEPVPA